MKLNKLGLLGVLGCVSFNQISNAQTINPQKIAAQVYAKNNANNEEESKESEKLNEQPPSGSAELDPLNPYVSSNPNRLIHLEYFKYVPEKQEEEDDLKYLEFLRKERTDRKKIEYLDPIDKIKSWMKVGISLYSTDWKGYPYIVSIRENDVELLPYEGVLEDVGKIPGLRDLGVISLNSTRKTQEESRTIEIKTVIRAKSYPGDVIASETRKIIVD